MIQYKDKIAALLAPHIEGLDAGQVRDLLEVPADAKMGDYALPCFQLAKTLHKAPPLIAQELAAAIEGEELFARVEPVKAYLNMFLSREAFAGSLVRDVLADPDGYGRSDIGQQRTVIVEFSSPNIAKPFHIGHIRSTVIGNSLYKIFDALGFKVVRINHLGDYGTQFGKMIVAYRRWGSREEVEAAPIKTLLSYYTKFHVEVEKDPSLDQEARDTFTRLEQGEKEEVELWQWFREESLKEFTRVYKMLGIEFDSYAGESFYSDKMPAIVQELKDKKLLQKSEGAQIVDLSDYDMPPALITKSDGSTLYITRDIAAAVYRKQHYDFYKNIYVVASAQNLHFQQWIKILELMGYDWAQDCVHVPFGLVSLEEGTMSTRHGRVVFLEDVLNQAVEKTREIILEKGVATGNTDEIARQVGIGAVIFQELSNNRIKDYVFKWDRVLNFDGETGPYVQYTHARAASVLRNAAERYGDGEIDGSDIDASVLTSDSAYDLARQIYHLPDVIVEAGDKYEPSLVTRQVIRIAESFNRFYHNEHVLVDDADERRARLALVAAAKTAIRSGLALLGIEAPERM
ncbi:MAG: arginine--tRNA ligase [Anaerovoracaceae bacterium]|jgi:arginyl-tRNA synthetase